MADLKPCPFCGDDGEKGRQAVKNMVSGESFDRIICRCCGAMCPEQNWNQRAASPFAFTADDALRIVMANWGDKDAIERAFRANASTSPIAPTDEQIIDLWNRSIGGVSGMPSRVVAFARALRAAGVSKSYKGERK